MKRVGIFGGSFDPVHTGHVEAAQSFLKSGLIEELWLLPSPSPPHKQRTGLTAFKHRLRMLQLAFEGERRVKISDLEIKLPFPSFTLQTIRHLKSEYPDCLFYLCIGEDSLVNFHHWHNYREILKECTLLVVHRPGYDLTGVNPDILERTVIVDHSPVQASSTEIREEPEPARDLRIPENVQRYIAEHQLYEDKTSE